MQLTLELKKAIENNAFCSIATYLENNENWIEEFELD